MFHFPERLVLELYPIRSLLLNPLTLVGVAATVVCPFHHEHILESKQY